jgi:hypothetical protein
VCIRQLPDIIASCEFWHVTHGTSYYSGPAFLPPGEV